MKRRAANFNARGVALGICVVAPWTAGLTPARAAVGLEVRAHAVMGNELRLVVESYRSVSPFYSHHETVTDAKGYAVFIDLGSDKPLKEHARVFGPLWDSPDSRSSMSFLDGVHFTDQDRKAARKTSYCYFDGSGNLLRLIRNDQGVLMRDIFVPSTKTANWKSQGERKPLPSATPGSEDRVQTLSREFVLFYQNSNATLFNFFTGETKQDPWLTKAFAQARSIKDFNNVRSFLTDDLNHLVVSPQGPWRDGWGKDSRLVEYFELDGKTYKRSDFVLAYNRTDPAPVIFPRAKDWGYLGEAPHGAFSIDGKLLLFVNDTKSLRLYRTDGTTEFQLDANGKALWPNYPFPQMQHDPARDKLFIFDDSVLNGTVGHAPILKVLEWSYKTGSLARHDVPVGELFKESWGKLQPRSAIEVK